MKYILRFINWVKSLFKRKPEVQVRDKNFYNVRDCHFAKAQEFYMQHRSELEALSFVMYYDKSVEEILMEDGNTIKSPICCGDIDGVRITFIDYPCLYYKFKNGKEGMMFCFREWQSTRDRRETRNFGFKKEVFRSTEAVIHDTLSTNIDFNEAYPEGFIKGN